MEEKRERERENNCIFFAFVLVFGGDSLEKEMVVYGPSGTD